MIKRETVLALVTIIISTLLCLLAAEYALRWYQRSIDNSFEGDPGLLRYDARLGWTLSPLWQGRHRHHDFDVQYTINAHGFRGEFPSLPGREPRRRIAVVGDSYGFGLGVNDEDVFTAVLNRQQRAVDFLNFSIPGYSTDQELLLIEERLGRFQVDGYLLMIYLANDILDNMLDYPLQVDQAKPWFRLDEAQQLQLQNVPVPRAGKPAALRAMTLNSVIFADELSRFEKRGMFARSQLLRRLLPERPAADRATVFGILDARLLEQKRLLKALLLKLDATSREQGRELRLAVLAGSSFILAPGSYSAWFQDYVRLFLLEVSEEAGIPLVDLAAGMRQVQSPQATDWYYPNEGHLTSEGHRVLSRLLQDALAAD